MSVPSVKDPKVNSRAGSSKRLAVDVAGATAAAPLLALAGMAREVERAMLINQDNRTRFAVDRR